MATKKKWVVQGFLEGNLYIPRSDSNFPIERGRVALTYYAILEQNLRLYLLRRPDSLKIFLGLEIPTDVDDVCVAYQEMEAFIRALSIEKGIPITVNIISMTDKQEEWPEGIGFLEARNFPICSKKWEPVDHYKDPKNRVRLKGGISSANTTRNLGPVLEERHQAFTAHDDYRSELVKDYLAGLDAEHKHPSLALLYYFKVLERVGKKEYGNPPKCAMTKTTMKTLIKVMGTELTEAEKNDAQSVRDWRNRLSEAHLTEDAPTQEQLRLCKKMAHFFLERALRQSDKMDT